MHKTASEFCMDLWRDMCGLPPLEPRRIPPLEELKQTEWCGEFEQMMRNRLIMACFRYGSFATKREMKGDYKYAEEGIKKLTLYLIKGNMEDLIDAANYCMLEFAFGQRENRHFKAKDDRDHAHHLGKSTHI